MNEHVLHGGLAKHLFNMGPFQEATHATWGDREPHTYVRGTEPIRGVWFSQIRQVGNHRSVLVSVSTLSAIGKQEFQVVHPHGRRLSSNNAKAWKKYVTYLECQMKMHRMADHLPGCEERINLYPAPPEVKLQMQHLDSQMVAECQCCQLYTCALPFRESIWVVHFQQPAYQALAKGASLLVQRSNAVQDTLKADIPTPRLLTPAQCLGGIESCSRKMKVLKSQAGGLW
jgi:hypothetical protein